MFVISISGNVESLRKSLLNEIEGLYDIPISPSEFLSQELAIKLAYFTGIINREIAVFINRKGKIIDISIGDSGTVSLPVVDGRRDTSRLSRIRCIHTHPNGDGKLSAVDISSLINLRLDAMVAIGVGGDKVTSIYAALPAKDENGDFKNAEVYGSYKLTDNKMNHLFDIIADLDKSDGNALYQIQSDAERAILVGLETAQSELIDGKSEGERSLEELEELAITAGCIVVQGFLQRKSTKDSTYYIGKGKIEEINLARQALNADVLIFDDELSGAQIRNIEAITGIKVIDRTTLILDIFAQRARSKEGKLQVELAQMKYRLPRLIGLGTQLSRLGGGIGTRGPGEKKLEVDRRHIRRKITFLEEELNHISKRRGYMREGRKKNVLPSVALVGYTNAGKSTLINKLCSSDVFAEDKLFATLDPTIRKFILADGRNIIFVDTVGFIRKLPHELVQAFKSTLEEAVFADILLHVVDASSVEAEVQITVVNDILTKLEASDKPVIIALNKMDKVKGDVRLPLSYADQKVVEISSVTGDGLDQLINEISQLLAKDITEINVLVPYTEGWIIPYIHENGKILETNYVEKGTQIKASIKKNKIKKIREYVKE